MNDTIVRRIDSLIAALLPNGVGTLSAQRLRTALEQVGHTAYTSGQSDALTGLRTLSDAAEAWGVSRQRASVHLARLHQQHAIGLRVRDTWLLTADEIERYRPGPPGRPRANKPPGDPPPTG